MHREDAGVTLRDGAVRPWRLPIAYSSVGSAVLAGDVVLILVTSVLSGIAWHLARFGQIGDLVHYLGIAVVAALAFTTLMRGRDLYLGVALLDLPRQLRGAVVNWCLCLVACVTIALLLRANGVFSRGAVTVFFFVGLASLLAHRVLWRRLLTSSSIQRRFRGPNVAVIALSPARGAAGTLERNGYRTVVELDLSGTPAGTLPRALEAAFQDLRGREVEEIYIAAGEANVTLDAGFLKALRVLPLPVRLLPAPATADILTRPTRVLGTEIAIELHRGPLDPFETALKRAFDVVVASLALVVFGPLLCLVALAVRLDSPGPVFFRQSRAGFNGRTFRILKFRSMTVTEDGARVAQARRHDARVTRFGHWIRRTSIDELPQLLNVLRGEMSLVGPRPHALAHDTHYAEAIGNYAFRHHVKPGLTGWAQVSGHRGETRSVDAMSARVAHDLWYIDHWTFWLDLAIIARTALKMLDIKDVY